ncbi:hypothetical protein RRG08_002600 [Elysia crispata]|uniref:Cystatin domain-containing protein n=1 Tax=Elysia crispata TaxID=231223 RepID=A0AAE1CT60_9GAST|nr:hypothetical protein RRG08_002600 [Elysia crispata]
MKSVALLSASLALLVTVNAQGLIGGQNIFTAKVTDPEVIFALDGINDFFASQDDTNNRTFVKIVQATSQVVRGVIYRYKIEVSGGPNGNEICDVAVWSQPWLDDPSLKEQIVGGITCQAKQLLGVAPNEEQEALYAFEKFLNRRLFNIYYVRVKNQPDLEEESSNGEERFNFSNIEMAYTNCMKSTASALADAAALNRECPVDDDTEVQFTCSATVVKKGDSYTVKSHQC